MASRRKTGKPAEDKAAPAKRRTAGVGGANQGKSTPPPEAPRLASGAERADPVGPASSDAVAAPVQNVWKGVNIVGVGMSAGGFEACSELLRALPPSPGFALVIVQHL